VRAILISVIAAFTITAAPTMAQQTNQNSKATSGPSQAEAPKPSQNTNSGSQNKTAAEAPSKPAQDNSMADFNVLGSTAQSAFGHDGP
jgi:hypothetical protein